MSSDFCWINDQADELKNLVFSTHVIESTKPHYIKTISETEVNLTFSIPVRGMIQSHINLFAVLKKELYHEQVHQAFFSMSLFCWTKSDK